MDDIRLQILKFWQSELKPISKSTIDKFNLSTEISSFLTAVGLPMLGGSFATKIEGSLSIRFFTDEDALFSFTLNGKNYLAIASDPFVSNIVVCIEEETDFLFHVVSYDLPEDGELTFINTNVSKFLSYLQIYLEEHLLLIKDDYSFDNPLKHAKNLTRKLSKADPQALEDEANFWSVVLEEIEYGVI